MPFRTSCTAARAAAGLPSARQMAARALPISPEFARPSSRAANDARASLSCLSRAWVASRQLVSCLASACEPSSCACRSSAALYSASAWWRIWRPAKSMPVPMCSNSLMPGPEFTGRSRCGRSCERGRRPGGDLLRLQEGPVGEHRLLASVVDDGGRAGRREATGEDPVTLRLEPVVERVDRRHLVRGGKVDLVGDY